MCALCAACGDEAVRLDQREPAPADRAACRALLDDLPEQVADQPARTVAPEPAWGAAWGDPPIVLSCGGPAPVGFDDTSACTTVNGVDWFIPQEQLEATEPVDLTMTTVNREQHVEVRLPVEYFPPASTLADLSDAVTNHVEPTGRCR